MQTAQSAHGYDGLENTGCVSYHVSDKPNIRDRQSLQNPGGLLVL